VKGIVYIKLSNKKNYSKTIMIFVEGTILKPKTFFSLYNHNTYIPIGNCVNLIRQWESQGAEIVYCTSRKKHQAQEVAKLIKQLGFIGTRLYYREKKQKYKDIVESVKPDILIEDDCKSIGGAWQMCITGVQDNLKMRIKSIVVKEFKGIDYLPVNILEL